MNKKYLLLIIFTFIFAIFGAIRFIKHITAYTVDVSPYVKRFDQIKTRLQGVEHIGYAQPNRDLRTFFLTQYALAPVVVRNNPKEKTVIGNFRRSRLFHRKKYFRTNYNILWDGGNGVMLLERKDPERKQHD